MPLPAPPLPDSATAAGSRQPPPEQGRRRREGSPCYEEHAEFDPQAAGTSTLTVVQPTGFTAPVDPYSWTTRTAVVDAPDLELQLPPYWNPSPAETIGRDLQVERRIGLEVAPPAPGVDVTVQVADPTVVAISTDPTTLGGASVTFPLVTGTATVE